MTADPLATLTTVKVDFDYGIAWITLNRPDKRNALNTPIVRETMAAFRRANESEPVRAIVLTGAGKVYCAGQDTKYPPEPKDENGRSPTTATLMMGKGERNWVELLATSKPNLIAVNGPAVGLGVTHILAADMRIAAASATFSFPFLRLGAMPECGASGLLPRLVGFGRAMDLCMRSATIDAREAQHIGLITGIHPDEELLGAALKLAEQIAAYPAMQVKLTKRMLYASAEMNSSEDILKNENAAFLEMFKALKRTKTFE